MKKILILLCALIIYNYSYCQINTTKDSTKISRNSVFLEIGGNAMIYSINYDYILPFNEYFKTAVTLGLTYFPASSYSVVGIAPQLNILIGRQLCVELGAGYTFFLPSKYEDNYPALRLGFRYQRIKGGFFGRIAFTPLLFPISENISYTPWFGLSIGYTFKSSYKKKNQYNLQQ